MNKESIEQLIAEYNQIESEQTKRLENIFLAMDDKKGYQRIKFSSGEMWTNCFNRPRLDLRLRQHVYRLERMINEVIIGQD